MGVGENPGESFSSTRKKSENQIIHHIMYTFGFDTDYSVSIKYPHYVIQLCVHVIQLLDRVFSLTL